MNENKTTELFRKHCYQQIVGSGSIPDFDEAFKYVFSTYKEELIKKIQELPPAFSDVEKLMKLVNTEDVINLIKE